MFRETDLDHNGIIDEEEFRQLIDKMGIEKEEQEI